MLINLLNHFVSTKYLYYFVLENCGFIKNSEINPSE